MTTTRKTLGNKGEEAACAFMKHHGFEIVERNWRCSYGEADIIALDGTTLIFCEVKTRKSTQAGQPEEAVTAKKQERYYKLAHVYRDRTTTPHDEVRFDVASINVYAPNRASIRYVPNAFGYGRN
jgi:putative endonuclease